MRPVPIPDEMVGEGVRRTIAPPGGDLTDPEIGPVDAVIDLAQEGSLAGVPRFNIRVVLEDGDLEDLTRTGHLWLTVYGRALPVFQLGPDVTQ